MKIEVLGSGCAKCKVLMQNAEKAVQLAGVGGTVEKVNDMQKILEYGVMLTPGLVINGQVVSSGKVLTAEEIIPFFSED